MRYFVKRESQEYGPYSLAEMQRSMASGDVLLTDLCRREEMKHWLLVSQIVGDNGGATSIVGGCGGDARVVPTATIAALGNRRVAVNTDVLLFGLVWAIVQAVWVKKVQPSSKALLYMCPAFVLIIAAAVRAFPDENLRELATLPNIAGLVLWIVASFNLKSSIEEHYDVAEPLGLTLSGAMTFFFNVYYFQYHFTRITALKRGQGQILGHYPHGGPPGSYA